MMDNYLSEAPSNYPQAKAIHMPSLQTRLDQAVLEAESRLKEAKEARDILAKHPDLERLLNIMQKGRF